MVEADLVVLVDIDKEEAEVVKDRYVTMGSRTLTGKEFTLLLLQANY
jgi:hypothetical protein